MKSESQMWRKIRPILVAAKLDPVRVENPIHPGTPDVNLANGCWVELKCIPDWPAREDLLLRIPHFTPQQRVWIYRRWKYAPGSTYLLLEIRTRQQWLLFDGDVAARSVGRSTLTHHREIARAILTRAELTELPRLFSRIAPSALDKGSASNSPPNLTTTRRGRQTSSASKHSAPQLEDDVRRSLRAGRPGAKTDRPRVTGPGP